MEKDNKMYDVRSTIVAFLKKNKDSSIIGLAYIVLVIVLAVLL